MITRKQADTLVRNVNLAMVMADEAARSADTTKRRAHAALNLAKAALEDVTAFIAQVGVRQEFIAPASATYRLVNCDGDESTLTSEEFFGANEDSRDELESTIRMLGAGGTYYGGGGAQPTWRITRLS